MDIVIKNRNSGKTTELALAMLMDDKQYNYIFSHNSHASMRALDVFFYLLRDFNIKFKYHELSRTLDIVDDENYIVKTIFFRNHEQMTAKELGMSFAYNTSLYADNMDMFRIRNIPLTMITATTKEVLSEEQALIESKMFSDFNDDDADYTIMQKPKKSSERVGIEYNHKSFWK